jgi:large subunit ribosomal protein L9
MAQEVLLMADVADLGEEGDVVSVNEGYARNYLLPKKLAAPVTDATRRQLTKLREQREMKRKSEVSAARELANRVAQVSLTIAVKTAEGEKLYGSVTETDVIDGLKDQGLVIDRHQVVMDEHIKELGVYDVCVRLHPEVETTVKVWVVEE